jgi:hypothetical protein
MVVHACHPCYKRSISKRIMVQACLGIKVRLCLKNKAKRDRGKAQVTSERS